MMWSMEPALLSCTQLEDLVFPTILATSAEDKVVILLETICMKCQNLFSGKNKKKIFQYVAC